MPLPPWEMVVAANIRGGVEEGKGRHNKERRERDMLVGGGRGTEGGRLQGRTREGCGFCLRWQRGATHRLVIVKSYQLTRDTRGLGVNLSLERERRSKLEKKEREEKKRSRACVCGGERLDELQSSQEQTNK